jgi:hypothetical protein
MPSFSRIATDFDLSISRFVAVLLVALRAILDQFRVWLQIGATTKNMGQSFLPDTREYNEKLR